MKVKEKMTKNVTSCSPQDRVEQAAAKMGDINVGALPVMDGERLVGIVTDRDIVLRNVSKKKDAAATPIGEIMSKNLVLGSPEMDVDDAAALMSRHKIRRLPVVDNGKLVGILSLGDLATAARAADEAGDALSDISTPSRPQYH